VASTAQWAPPTLWHAHCLAGLRLLRVDPIIGDRPTSQYIGHILTHHHSEERLSRSFQAVASASSQCGRRSPTRRNL